MDSDYRIALNYGLYAFPRVEYLGQYISDFAGLPHRFSYNFQHDSDTVQCERP